MHFENMKKLAITLVITLISLSAIALNDKAKDNNSAVQSVEEILEENAKNRIKIYNQKGELVKTLRSEKEDMNLIRKSDLLLDDGKDKIFIVYTR